MFTRYCASAMLAAMLAISPAAFASDKAPDCHLKELEAIDLVALPDGKVAVPVSLNGQTESLLLDTSVGYSQLDRSTISQLWLRAYERSDSTYAYRVDRFQVGRLGPYKMGFLPAAVGTLRKGVVGTLGMQFLRNFDVELDLQHAKLILFSPQHCPGQVIYWSSGPYTRVALEKPNYWYAPHIPVVLDGKPFSASIDTTIDGALIEKLPAQEAFGFSEQEFPLKKTGTVSGNDIYEHSFKLLSFGGVAISHPQIQVMERGQYSEWDDKQIYIGMNILRRLHLYIANKEGFMYITGADAH